jgi:phage tail protein X
MVPAQQLAVLRPAEQPVELAEAAAEAQREEVAPQALAAQPMVVPAVLAARDAAAGLQPVVASGAEVRQPEVAAVLDAAVGVRPQGAARVAVAAVRLRGAVLDAGALRRAARDAQGVLLLAAAWAALPLTRLQGDRPALSARVAHARRQLRTARP